MTGLFSFAVLIAPAKVPVGWGRAAKRKAAFGGLGCSDSGLIYHICIGTGVVNYSCTSPPQSPAQCQQCGSGLKSRLGSHSTVSVDTSLVFSLLGETNPLACASLHTLCGSSCLCFPSLLTADGGAREEMPQVSRAGSRVETRV